MKRVLAVPGSLVLGVLVAAAAAITIALAWLAPNGAPADDPGATAGRTAKMTKAAYDQSMRDWQLRRLRDPATGRIPPDVRSLDYAWYEAQKTLASAPADRLTADPPTWTARGPFDVGGRTRDVEIDVTDERILLVASAGGGIWRSEDAGQTWRKTLRSDQLPRTTCLAQDLRAGRTHIWYAGTGEAAGSNSAPGGGIYKSIDGGRSWELLLSTRNKYDFLYVYQVAVDPSNANADEIYAATSSGVYRSTNGGGSWSLVLAGSFGHNVLVAPNGVVYAAYAADPVVGTEGAAVFRSADGVNWTAITPPVWPAIAPVTSLALSHDDPNRVFFYTEETNAQRFLCQYTWLSGNGSGTGGAWVDRSSQVADSRLATYGGYCQAVACGRNGPDDLYLAGVWTSHYDPQQGRFVPIGEPSPPHADGHAFAFPASDPNVVYVATDGGLYRANDASYAFASLDQGFVTTQFYNVGINMATADDALIGGTQDNGTVLAGAGGVAPFQIGGGDGGRATILPDGGHALHSLYGDEVYLRTLPFQGDALVRPPLGTGYRMVFPVFATDPNSGYTIYYPVGTAVWRAVDVRAQEWVRLTEPSLGVTPVTAIGVSQANPPHRLYFANADGLLARQDAATGAPGPATVVTPPWAPGIYPSSISVDPEDGDKVLATVSNYNVKSLFWSEDAGATWTEVGGNLDVTTGQLLGYQGPAVLGSAILARHDGTRVFFAATTAGLFTTTQLQGASTVWAPEAPSLIGNVEVDEVVARSRDGFVAVGTHGAGLFSAVYPGGTTSVLPTDARNVRLETVVPNPVRGTTAGFAFILPRRGRARLEIFDAAGRRASLVAEQEFGEGRHALRWEPGRLAPGKYFLRLTTPWGRRVTSLVLTR